MDRSWWCVMNDVNRNQYDDEIDLFEVVEILWKSKWIITASVFVSLVIATAYLAYTPTVYLYSAHYTKVLNVDDNRLKHNLSSSPNSLSLDTKKSTISLTTSDPSLFQAIDTKIKNISNQTTQELASDAKYTLKMISTETPDGILSTETVAKNYVAAKRLLNKINNGKKAIEFQPVVKTIKSPKTSLVLALSVIGGGMMGLILVFMLRMIAAYKKRQHTKD
jgi:LPS O-antigen subunit length determinant protein (WzzB/FepE family)